MNLFARNAQTDARTLVRIAIDVAGRPVAIVLVSGPKLPADVFARISQSLADWMKTADGGVMLVETPEIRFEFVTVAQLTGEGRDAQR